MPERKILIITNRVPYPLSDGGNLAMNSMIQGYHNAGWKVYLLSMNTTRHPLSQSKLATLFTNIYAFGWVDINNDIKPLNIPAFYGAMIGHIENKYTIPLGIHAQIDAATGMIQLAESAVA